MFRSSKYIFGCGNEYKIIIVLSLQDQKHTIIKIKIMCYAICVSKWWDEDFGLVRYKHKPNLNIY